MIFQEGGRWRSEPDISEAEQDIDDIVSKLSPGEYASLQELLKEYEANGNSELANTCAELEWEEVPVPIAEWLETPELIGDTGETIFPVLKQDMIELFTGGYHEVILCLHPDTRIPLLDGSTPTISELAIQWEEDQTPFWVYSYKDGEISPARAIQPRQTGVDDYYRVTLDDGSTFTGNACHQMLRPDGTKFMIKDMVPGDSIMPFNTAPDCDGAGNHYVVSIERVGRGPVYCMTVPDAGNFAIATQLSDGKEVAAIRRAGVLSSNTGSIGW